MKKALRVVVASLICVVIGCRTPANGPSKFSAREIPVGSPSVLVEASEADFPRDGTIIANSTSIPFRAYSRHIELLIPGTLLKREQVLEIEFQRQSQRKATTNEIRVVPRKFAARIEIEANRNRLHSNELLSITIRIHNDDKSPFYIPTNFDPLVVGHVLSAGVFEIFKEGVAVPFLCTLIHGQGGVLRNTDKEFLSAGEIVRVNAGETHTQIVETSLAALTANLPPSGTLVEPGRYRLRLQFFGTNPQLKEPADFPFMKELIYSNEIELELLANGTEARTP